jgi:hypothetical protein
MNQITRAAALAVTVVVFLAMATTASPVAAATKPLVDLRGDGDGSYVLDTAGTAHLSGSVVGRPFDGAYAATLAADDGSLPAPGSCEPATGTLEVTGSRDRTLRLAAVGEVCGEFPDATYVVNQRFVGRYVVTDASSHRLRGTDGWTSLILATEGRANVEAIDT